VTHLRQIMLEELERRNYAPGNSVTAYALQQIDRG
jgi:hypothetical protein